MANEATIVELLGANNSGDKRRYTCADATAITKGTLLRLLDPRTASGAILTGAIFAGIASMDKEASDGSTSISCWTNGIFEIKASGAIAIGAKVKMAGLPANSVMQIDSVQDPISSFAIIVGTALETAAADEVINVRVLI